MPYCTLFWSIYTNLVCSLIKNTEILILLELKKIQILSRHHNDKQNCFEYNLSEKIYNALFYFFLEYIQKLNMLSHVKYQNSNFMRIEKNQNYIQAPQRSKKIALNIVCQKKIYNALFYFVLEYIHQLNMLSRVKYKNSNST